MARDSHIIRPDRTTRQAKAAPQEITREERVKLLVAQVLCDVRATLDAKKPQVRAPGKR